MGIVSQGNWFLLPLPKVTGEGPSFGVGNPLSPVFSHRNTLLVTEPRQPFAQRLCQLAGWTFGVWLSSALAEPIAPTYNTDIRPILSEHCFKCHGADEKARKGNLRLDESADAVAKKAIIPGKPDESTLLQRILTSDPDEVMPPPKEHKALTEVEKEKLRAWIAAGAPYQKHWAFIPPVKAPIPVVSGSATPVTNPIDSFVLAKLAEWKLQPAPPATKEEWLRRVTFDLTGLPPTLAEQDAFRTDTSANAREKVVDRLLDTPQHAERLTQDWLDVTRYADTYGRHEDSDSVTWPWRDWVLRAFRQNMPYDQFLTQQTAGDMLPDATRDQKLATLFNRLAQQSNESGSHEEEFRLEQVSDRVHANAEAFLGLTMECARCHDHKYDPITTREYYEMAAFFGNIDELGIYPQYTKGIPSPSLLLPDAAQEQELTALRAKMKEVEQQLTARREAAKADYIHWIQTNGGHPSDPLKPIAYYPLEEGTKDKQVPNALDPAHPGRMRSTLHFEEGKVGKAALFRGDDELTFENVGIFRRPDPFSFSIWIQPREARDRTVVASYSRSGVDAGRGYELLLDHGVPEFALQHTFPGGQARIRATKFTIPLNEWTHFACTYDGSARASGMRLYINGQVAETEVVRDNLLKDIIARPEWEDPDLDKIYLQIGGRYNDGGVRNGLLDEFQVFSHTLTPPEVLLLAGHQDPPETWGQWFSSFFSKPPPPMQWLDWYLREKDEASRKLTTSLHALRTRENDILCNVLEVMVMEELPKRRPTHILSRGQWNSPADEVAPGTPAAVLPFPEEFPRNRLGFARWLVDRRNPLTSRVEVNRIWQMFFGRGFTATPQDFGTRGEIPAHATLLDWLAVNFQDTGWDIRALCRLIALSSAYAQSSRPTDPALLESDPENARLARGPRLRLSAEELRDQALAVSGLLVPEIGGPSVRPYLPAGLYEQSGIMQGYNQQKGPSLYRRSLYTFWRRTLPPPSLAIFDAPTREVCRSRRENTNTPLQSLVLLNDVQFVEAQRVLAEKLVKQYPQDDGARLADAFRLLTGTRPNSAQSDILQQLLTQERAAFAADPAAAAEVCKKNGEHATDSSLPPVEVAATAAVMRALFSFQETVMKP